MLTSSVLSFLALATSLSLTSAKPIQRRDTCSPSPSGTVNIVWAGNTTLQLGTSDCEACTYLGLYTGQIDYFQLQGTGTETFKRIYSPNYSGQVLTVDTSSTVSPIYRAPQSVYQDANQANFNFACDTCYDDGTSALNCAFQFVQGDETLCVTTNGALNVGGISLQPCNGAIGQVFNVVPTTTTSPA